MTFVDLSFFLHFIIHSSQIVKWQCCFYIVCSPSCIVNIAFAFYGAVTVIIDHQTNPYYYGGSCSRHRTNIDLF